MSMPVFVIGAGPVCVEDAITERNPEKARSAMRAHLENAERNWMIAKTGMPSRLPEDEPGD